MPDLLSLVLFFCLIFALLRLADAVIRARKNSRKNGGNDE